MDTGIQKPLDAGIQKLLDTGRVKSFGYPLACHVSSAAKRLPTAAKRLPTLVLPSGIHTVTTRVVTSAVATRILLTDEFEWQQVDEEDSEKEREEEAKAAAAAGGKPTKATKGH